MLSKNIFSLNFFPPNIWDQNFCPPIFMTSLHQWQRKWRKKINMCEMWIWRKMQRRLMKVEIGIEEETLQQTVLRRTLARILWTCYAIRWIEKRNDDGRQRGKEEERTTKEKMDGRDTWSNWNEAGGTKRRDDRKETLEKDCQGGH